MGVHGMAACGWGYCEGKVVWRGQGLLSADCYTAMVGCVGGWVDHHWGVGCGVGCLGGGVWVWVWVWFHVVMGLAQPSSSQV